MKHTTALKTLLLLTLLAGATTASRAGTIAQGIASTTGATPAGSPVAGTIDSAYLTAVFGNNAYVQDGTGGIYAFSGSKAGNALNGLPVGTLLNTLANGSFSFFTGGTVPSTQFEYATSGSTVNFTLGSSSTGGTVASIPASYYTTVTPAALNSAADQGSATTQGIQNQLVTLNNVLIAPTGTAGAATFTANGSYTLTDTVNGGSVILFVNAASGLVGATVPPAATTVSGVFQDFKGTSEVLPRGAFDVAGSTAVPEPATCAYVLGGFGLLLLLGRRRRLA